MRELRNLIERTLILGRFLPRSRLFGRLALTTATAAAEGYTASPDTSAMVGQTGVALTPLRPAGAARIDGQHLDVVTSGEFINAGAMVRVVEAHGNRIVVAQAEAKEQQAEGRGLNSA